MLVANLQNNPFCQSYLTVAEQPFALSAQHIITPDPLDHITSQQRLQGPHACSLGLPFDRALFGLVSPVEPTAQRDTRSRKPTYVVGSVLQRSDVVPRTVFANADGTIERLSAPWATAPTESPEASDPDMAGSGFDTAASDTDVESGGYAAQHGGGSCAGDDAGMGCSDCGTCGCSTRTSEDGDTNEHSAVGGCGSSCSTDASSLRDYCASLDGSDVMRCELCCPC